MSYMKAVGSRVESYVKFDLFILQKFSYLFLIGRLLNKSSLFKYIIDVVKLADIVRYKIKFHLLFLRKLIY